jgi:hypothetical protein
MTARSISPDDQLLISLQGPPDLRLGVDSLAYWRERRRRLSWYRVRARREASRMILTWEQRVRGALVSQRGVPIELRVSAGVLLAQTVLRRWGRRAGIAITATIVVAFLAAPLIASAVFLAHAL